MRKITIICIGILPILLGVYMSGLMQKEEIRIISKSSYFSDFSVVGQKVLIKCSVTLESTYKIDKTIKLSANMDEDVSGGLLKEAKVYALNDNGTIAEYTVKSNSQDTFNVVFVGDYAGTNEKQNRLLPEISIEIIK